MLKKVKTKKTLDSHNEKARVKTNIIKAIGVVKSIKIYRPAIACTKKNAPSLTTAAYKYS